MMIAYVRVLKVKNSQYLIKQRRHAHRKDTTSEVRPGAEAGTALIWTPPRMPEGGDPRDYCALYASSKKRLGFAEREGAAIGMHLLVGVSPSWINAKGGLHDPVNPRNQKLLDEAVAWVKSWAGEDSVFGARLDLDEAGGGVVDVFCAPTAEQKHKSGTTRLTISVNKALTKLQTIHEADYSYEALQTSWHAWAQEHLDLELQRGEPAHKTNRRHLRVGEYKRQQDHLKAEEVLCREQEELACRAAAVTEQVKLNREATADLERKTKMLAQAQKDIFKAAVAVLSDPNLRAIHPPGREQDQRWFDTPDFEAQRPAIMQARPLWPVMRQLVEVVQEKHRIIDGYIEKLHALRSEVDDHLRERIEQMAEEVNTSSTFGCCP
jgi:hypothetical protein